MTAGLNRFTGQPLAGFAHVEQSLGVIFTTRLTSRFMRRTFGFAGVGLLGQPLTPGNLLRFYMAIVIAVELWEPRFKVTSLDYPTAQNSADRLRQGRFGVTILGQYMPNALEGDFTVAATVSVVL
jgi:phage baseplate assembly protein W